MSSFGADFHSKEVNGRPPLTNAHFKTLAVSSPATATPTATVSDAIAEEGQRNFVCTTTAPPDASGTANQSLTITFPSSIPVESQLFECHFQEEDAVAGASAVVTNVSTDSSGANNDLIVQYTVVGSGNLAATEKSVSIRVHPKTVIA